VNVEIVCSASDSQYTDRNYRYEMFSYVIFENIWKAAGSYLNHSGHYFPSTRGHPSYGSVLKQCL
jgi:hypothetical protein